MTESEPGLDLVVEGMVSLARTASRAWRNASARTELASPWRKRRRGSPSLDQTGSRSVRRIPWSSCCTSSRVRWSSSCCSLMVTVVTGEYVDAGVIAAVLILNAAIGFFQEREADRSVRSLPSWWRLGRGWCAWGTSERSTVGMWYLATSSCSSPVAGSPADVSRGGNRATGRRVAPHRRVRPGCQGIAPVPEGTELADRTNMAYAGTVVASGRAWGYTIATGPATALGAIATRCGRSRQSSHLAAPARQLRAHYWHHHGRCRAHRVCAWPCPRRDPTEMFKVAVALAVAAVPEGLPIAGHCCAGSGRAAHGASHAVIRRCRRSRRSEALR